MTVISRVGRSGLPPAYPSRMVRSPSPAGSGSRALSTFPIASPYSAAVPFPDALGERDSDRLRRRGVGRVVVVGLDVQGVGATRRAFDHEGKGALGQPHRFASPVEEEIDFLDRLIVGGGGRHDDATV